MDLSQAEKTLSDLEENGKKVAEVSRSIEKLKKISKELSKLPEDIEKNQYLKRQYNKKFNPLYGYIGKCNRCGTPMRKINHYCHRCGMKQNNNQEK